MLPSCHTSPLYSIRYNCNLAGVGLVIQVHVAKVGDPQVNVCTVLRMGRFFQRGHRKTFIEARPCREGHRSFPFQRRQRHPVLFEVFLSFVVCWTGDRPPFFVQGFACLFVCLLVCLFVCLFVCLVTSILGGLSWRRGGRPSERLVDRCVFGGPGAKPALRVAQLSPVQCKSDTRCGLVAHMHSGYHPQVWLSFEDEELHLETFSM